MAAIVIPTVLLLVMTGLMLWRWKKYDDPLPPRLRTVYNRTMRRGPAASREGSNPVYARYLKSAANDYARPPPAYSKNAANVGH